MATQVPAMEERRTFPRFDNRNAKGIVQYARHELVDCIEHTPRVLGEEMTVAKLARMVAYGLFHAEIILGDAEKDGKNEARIRFGVICPKAIPKLARAREGSIWLRDANPA